VETEFDFTACRYGCTLEHDHLASFRPAQASIIHFYRRTEAQYAVNVPLCSHGKYISVSWRQWRWYSHIDNIRAHMLARSTRWER